MTGDSVVKTLLILFMIAVTPLVLAMLAFVAWVWLGVIWSA